MKKGKLASENETLGDYEQQFILNLHPKISLNAEKMSKMKQAKPKFKDTQKHSFGNGKQSSTFDIQEKQAAAKQRTGTAGGYSKTSTLDNVMERPQNWIREAILDPKGTKNWIHEGMSPSTDGSLMARRRSREYNGKLKTGKFNYQPRGINSTQSQDSIYDGKSSAQNIGGTSQAATRLVARPDKQEHLSFGGESLKNRTTKTSFRHENRKHRNFSGSNAQGAAVQAQNMSALSK